MKDGEGAQHGGEGDVSYTPTPLAAGHLEHVQAPRAGDTEGSQPQGAAATSTGGTRLATGPAPRPCLRDTSQSKPTAERDPRAVCGQAQLLGQGCQPPAPLQSRAHAAPSSPGLVLSLRLLRPSCLRGPGELGQPEGFGCSAWLRALRPCNTDKILSSPRCAQCRPPRGRT
ncbi:uncharacterized protein WM294_013832 [Sarcoramphus papa]